MKNRITNLMIFLGILITYLFVPPIISGIISGVLNIEGNVYTNFIGNFACFIIFLVFYFNDIKEGYKKIKNEKLSTIWYCMKYWALGLLIMMSANFILNVYVFNGNIASNEEAVREQLFSSPLWIAFFSVSIMAPVCEELIFRLGIKKFTKNKKIYIILSGFIFGLLHSISGINTIKDLINLLYIIPYGALGSVFAYVYTKKESIICPMLMHFIHNTFTFLLLITVYLQGAL